MICSYRELKVYQRSYAMALRIYELVKKIPEEERYGIISQMKRAALSIPLNVAEGYGKNSSANEFKRFLQMAMGSCSEMTVLTEFCRDMKYFDSTTCDCIVQEYDEIGKMLNKMNQNWRQNSNT